MFSEMTSAQTVGMWSIVILIAVPALALLTTWGAFHLPMRDSFAYPREAWSSTELGQPSEYSYREPADPALVDALADRVHGVARVFHNPSPQTTDDDTATAPEPLDDIPHLELPAVPTYRVTLADLIEGARYVVPIPTRHVSTEPARPAAPAHYSGTIDDTAGRHSDRVGRHRAPITATPARRELVAA